MVRQETMASSTVQSEHTAPTMTDSVEQSVPLSTIVREWSRIGIIGFGGPPTHIALLRKLCVDDRSWLSPQEFEDGIAATNLLPGPASTQLAIFCGWRLRGRLGALLGGICFIIPGLVIILALSIVFLAAHPPLWVLGAAAGAGAAVPAVAVNAASVLVPASWRRAGDARSRKVRWTCYFLIGGVSAATIGPYLVLVLTTCGVVEIVASRGLKNSSLNSALVLFPTAAAPVIGGIAALCWVALKVGALSYGGGFVIIPLMQHDAVVTYHWMTGAQFLNAVALGQITPGPVVQTVAVVGYAAGGIGGGLLAALIAFAPSFVFVMGGARHFDRLRADARIQLFLTGAGAAVIGAIAGSAIPLGRELAHLWQLGILALAAGWLLGLRRSVVSALLAAGAAGVVAVMAGAPA
jgi:chromate transporter